MKNTISIKLLKTLQRGKEQLGAEALRKVVDFVESQRTEEGAFKDKSGKADLYYTSFGLALSYILDIKANTSKLKLYLSQQNKTNLDLVHYAAYMRCRMIIRLMRSGKIGVFLRSLLPTRIKALRTFKIVPHNNFSSPYSQFLWLSIQEDVGRQIREKAIVLDELTNYHARDGGYRNTWREIVTTNATVAAMSVINQLKGKQYAEDERYLCNIQNTSGGFSATEDSPVSDLLSTATALFMLSCCNIKPKYSAHNFIEAHWLDSGGFSATLLEDKSDVEYTFYGLLALGAIGN